MDLLRDRTEPKAPAADPVPWLTAQWQSAGCFATALTDALSKGFGGAFSAETVALAGMMEAVQSTVASLHDDETSYSVKWSVPKAAGSAVGATDTTGKVVYLGTKALTDPTLTEGQRAAVMTAVAAHEVGHIRWSKDVTNLLSATYSGDEAARLHRVKAMLEDAYLEARLRRDFIGLIEVMNTGRWWVWMTAKATGKFPVTLNAKGAQNRIRCIGTAMLYPWAVDYANTDPALIAMLKAWQGRYQATDDPAERLEIVVEVANWVYAPEPEPEQSDDDTDSEESEEQSEDSEGNEGDEGEDDSDKSESSGADDAEGDDESDSEESGDDESESDDAEGGTEGDESDDDSNSDENTEGDESESEGESNGESDNTDDTEGEDADDDESDDTDTEGEGEGAGWEDAEGDEDADDEADSSDTEGEGDDSDTDSDDPGSKGTESVADMPDVETCLEEANQNGEADEAADKAVSQHHRARKGVDNLRRYGSPDGSGDPIFVRAKKVRRMVRNSEGQWVEAFASPTDNIPSDKADYVENVGGAIEEATYFDHGEARWRGVTTRDDAGAARAIASAMNSARRGPGRPERMARAGRVDRSRLSRVPQGDPRVFVNRMAAAPQRVRVSILVDGSASMAGGRLQNAMKTARDIAMAIDSLEWANGRVYVHTTDDNGVVVYSLWKSGEDRELLNSVNGVEMQNNGDGYALAYVCDDLLEDLRSGEKGVVIVISDGLPSQYARMGYDGYGESHVREVVSTYRRMGLRIVSIAIAALGNGKQEMMYGHQDVIAYDPEPAALARNMAKVIGSSL